MNILERIHQYALEKPTDIVIYGDYAYMTYKQLDEYSDYLAAYLDEISQDQSPIPIYGHKTPMMLVAMIACAKSGRAYCPIDISVPYSRVEDILKQLDSEYVLAVEELQCNFKKVISNTKMSYEIKHYKEKETRISKKMWVTGEDIFYIIFTSGSTGNPKGVQITTDCLNNYLKWSVNLGNSENEKKGKVFLNQAPFSFDLSVMDTYTSLACGGSIWALTKKTQQDYQLLMESLKKSQVSVWVSTPSFAEICLSEKRFNEEWMPQLRIFLFCGETLSPKTAKRLQKRFPKAKIINTYGPTESTVAVTEVLITPELLENDRPLPVGKVKPESKIEIWSEDGTPLAEGEKGEIIILGNTVSCGYYKNPQITEKVLFKCEQNGVTVRGYHTGDKGYLLDGQLYYCGRIDLQVKLHGYRIELEDIENNILKLHSIKQVVVVPKIKNEKVHSLLAYIVYQKIVTDKMQTSIQIKNELKKFLPGYMIPKKFVFLDQIPTTNNGKSDRRLLGGI